MVEPGWPVLLRTVTHYYLGVVYRLDADPAAGAYVVLDEAVIVYDEGPPAWLAGGTPRFAKRIPDGVQTTVMMQSVVAWHRLPVMPVIGGDDE